MQTTVGDEEYLATRDLAIQDAADIQSCLPHQVPAELDHEFGVRQRRPRLIDDSLQIVCDGLEFEWLFALEVRNAKAPAQVQNFYRTRRIRGETFCECQRLLLRFADRFVTQVLRTG